MRKLEKCPKCGEIDYAFAATWGSVLRESANAIPAILMNGKKGIFTSATKSGNGIFSFAKLLFSNLPENPLLVCCNCNTFVISCPHCEEFLTLERRAGVAEVIQCQNCNNKFFACETYTNPFQTDLGIKRR